MVWERVDGGLLGTGEPFVIERQVFHPRVPYSVSPLLIRRRRYRLMVQAPDGTFTDAGQARTRNEIDTLVRSLVEAPTDDIASD